MSFSVRITRRGTDEENEAGRLYEAIRAECPDTVVSPSQEAPEADAALGATEVIITIIAMPIAKAAMLTFLDFLETYLQSRVEEDSNLRGQVVIKKSEEEVPAKRYPFRLSDMKKGMISKLIAMIKEQVSRL